MQDSKGEHNYTSPTWSKHLVAEYTGLSFNEIKQLNYIEYLVYRRDAFIHLMNSTPEGKEYLRNAWRIEQTEPDRVALRRKFGRREASANG